MKNIVITGMSGAGKSELGKALAEMTGWPWYDTDTLIIEKTDISIPEIFKRVGEEGFRDIESEVVRSLEDQTGIIISTGGGVVLREENIRSLKKNGRIFFLRRDVEDILPSDDRPLADTVEKVKALYQARLDIYLQTADAVVDATDIPEETARKLLLIRAEIH